MVSIPNAKAMNIDISNFYLNMPHPRKEYMRIPIALIPDEIGTMYNLHTTCNPAGYVYIAIKKGMYGLPQVGILANQLVRQRLAAHGFFLVRHTPGYWKHITKATSFVLVDDDFAVKYIDQHDADDCMAMLQQWCTINIDHKADLYCGIKTDWNYATRTGITLSMPGYIQQYKVSSTIQCQNVRNSHPIPTYLFNMANSHNLPIPPDQSTPLSTDDPIQPARIIGKLLYYACAVDCSLNVTLSALTAEQNKPIIRTKKNVLHLLDYSVTNPNAKLLFRASEMILHLHSDASGCTCIFDSQCFASSTR